MNYKNVFGRNVRSAALLCAGLASTTPTFASPAKPITVTPVDAPALKKAIAAQKGHVVVVNFWATWCIPCVAEFPALVNFQHRYKSAGVVVMAVSADMRKDLPTKVVPFLTKQHADFPQYLEQAKDPEDFINAFDPNWYGDLPRTFIYDKSGRLVKELQNQQTMKSFYRAVKPLLR